MKETREELTAIAARLDEKLPGFFAHLREERDAFERDYDEFMWKHYPEIELSFDFDTLYWVSCLRSYLIFDRYSKDVPPVDGIMVQSVDGWALTGKNEFAEIAETCSSFCAFFTFYCQRPHEKPFMRGKRDPLLFSALGYSLGLPRVADSNRVSFADRLRMCRCNEIRKALGKPLMGANMEHLLPVMMDYCHESLQAIAYRLVECQQFAILALGDSGAADGPDLAHRKQIVADWFAQSLHLLDRKCLVGSRLISFDDYLERYRREWAAMTEEEKNEKRKRKKEVSSWTNAEECAEFFELDEFLKNHDEGICRETLGKIVMELFSKESIILAYYHTRWLPTEENVKELLVRILIRRKILTAGRIINIYFDENRQPYMTDPITVLLDKTGYNALHQLSIDEMVADLRNDAEHFEREAEERIDTIIASIKSRLLIVPCDAQQQVKIENLLDRVILGGREGLSVLSGTDIKLKKLPSEQEGDWFLRRNPSGFRALSDFADKFILPGAGWKADVEQPIELLNMGEIAATGFLFKERFNQFRMEAAPLLPSRREGFLQDEPTDRSEDMPGGKDWGRWCAICEQDLLEKGIIPETCFGDILRFPSPQERYAEQRVMEFADSKTAPMQSSAQTNQSLRLLRDVPAERETEDNVGMLRHFPGNMDYMPLVPLARQIQYRTFLLNRLSRAYLQVVELGHLLEDLEWANQLLSMKRFRSLNTELMDAYVARLRNRVYGDLNEKWVKSYYQDVDVSFEQNLLWTLATDCLVPMLDCFTVDMLPQIVRIKDHAMKAFLCEADSERLHGYAERLMDQITDKIRERVQETEYNFPESDPISEIACCKDRIIALYGEDGHFSKGDQEISFDEMIENARAYVKAGELLYRQFVADPKAEKLSDYGCVAIEYYKALEYLANQILYRPYYLKELSAVRVTNERDGQGYCGSSFMQITYPLNGGSIRRYKDHLEYGTLARFLSGITDRRLDNALFTQVIGFYRNGRVDPIRVGGFAYKMNKTSRDRNDCAHPKEAGKGFAVKARVSVYDRSYGRDDIRTDTTEVAELIRKLGEIFA